jgi:sterol desaturase/sphingolipid hydroxylase (fatty acid hydroxylase superfamily)
MIYDWKATLVFFALLLALTLIGRFLAFKVPELQRMREVNQEKDQAKKAMEKYPPVIRASGRVGLISNAVFILGILPFLITLNTQPIWLILLQVFIILMVYDFFYYLTHRFLFHGNSFLRQIHALHHQARSPSHIDAYYVHALETFIGVALFLGTVLGLSFVFGAYHAVTLSISFLIFTQLNIINHASIDLPCFPFKTLNYITTKHSVHHKNMHKGNYASITLFYDYLFGTLD